MTQLLMSELYIDNKYLKTSDLFLNVTWNEFSFGKHTLKLISFDMYGNRDYEEIEVWKFF